jgi:hypothetical protein
MSTILFRDMHGNASLLVFVLIYCETFLCLQYVCFMRS